MSCSGAMYCGVPMRAPARVSGVASAPRGRDPDDGDGDADGDGDGDADGDGDGDADGDGDGDAGGDGDADGVVGDGVVGVGSARSPGDEAGAASAASWGAL